MRVAKIDRVTERMSATDNPQNGYYQTQIAPLLALAWPLILSQASWTLLMTIDTIMVGQYSAVELSYLGLGRSLVFFCWGTGFGFLAGVLVYIAQAYGAERMRRAGLVFRTGLAMSIVVGAGLFVMLQFVGLLFAAANIEADLADKAAQYAKISAPGLFAGMVFMVGTQFLEALARPKPVMVISLSSAFMNVVLNWLLIYGAGPIPAMGANGAALGTTLVTIGAMLWILWHIAHLPDRARFGLDVSMAPLWAAGRAVWKFGLPIGIAISLEMLAFAVLTIMAGTQGKGPVAAYEIFVTLLYLPLAIVVGFAQASAIRVGHAVGAADYAVIPSRISIGVILNAGMLVPFCLACLLAPDWLAASFTSDTEVAGNAAPLVRFLGVVLITYAVFYGIANPVRSMGDATGAAVVQIAINWLILVPLAAYWLFGEAAGINAIPPALLIAMAIGCGLIGKRAQIVWQRF